MSTKMEVKLRRVFKQDWDYILKLRNDKDFRSNFYDTHNISRKEHYEYLKKKESNPNFFNWIISYDDKDVGYLRILNSDVSIIIDRAYHEKGIGTKALRLLEKEAKKIGIKKLVGKVMVHNKNSEKIFVKNDYKLLMYWYEKVLGDSIKKMPAL